MQKIKYFVSAVPHRPPSHVYKWQLVVFKLYLSYLSDKSEKLQKNSVKTTLIRAKWRGFAKSRPAAHWPTARDGPAAQRPSDPRPSGPQPMARDGSAARGSRQPGGPEAWWPSPDFQVFCPAVNPRACTDLHRVWTCNTTVSLNSLTRLYSNGTGCLRRPTFGLGRLKERNWSLSWAPCSLVFLSVLPEAYRLICS